MIGAVDEEAAPDAAAPARRIDIEGVELGVELHVGVARRAAAEGESDDCVIFDSDKDGAVGRTLVQSDSRPMFPSARDPEGRARLRGNDVGVGRVPRMRMNPRDAVEILGARQADHAAFRRRKE
jgi:hypothetical protein